MATARKVFALVVLGLLGLMLAGCHNSGHAQNSANMRAVNAVENSEALDVLVDGTVKLPAVGTGTISGFVEFDSGTRDIQVRSSSNSSVLSDKQLTFGDGSTNTLLIFGPRSSVNTLVLPDDTTAPTSGNFNLRAVGLSAETGPVDIYLTASGDITGATSPTLGGVAFGATTGIVQPAASSYQIVFAVAGTKDILFTSAPQTFAAGTSYAVMVYPTGGGHLANALVLVQGQGGTGTLLLNPQGRVKAVNAIPDSTTLTFKADGAALLSSVPFGGSSNYVSVKSGNHTFTLEQSTVPGSTIASVTKSVDAASDYSIFAVNKIANPALLLFKDDNSLPATGFARVRFVNAMADATAVDVLLNFAAQTTNLAPRTASGYYSIAPSLTYTVTFTTAGGVTVLATLSNQEIDAGGVYTAYVVGTAGGAQAKISRDR